ncbi:MAG: hypothetical protein SGPRY_010742, partial [Prymnesium sp.]
AICAATNRSRKAFDAQAARWTSSGAEEALQLIAKAKRSDPEPKRRVEPKWRRQSAQLRQFARANRAPASSASDALPPSLGEEEDDRIPCKHCGRRFVSSYSTARAPAAICTL